MIIRIILLILSLIPCLSLCGQGFSISTKEIYNTIAPQLAKERELSTANLMVKGAKMMLGTEYVASTLEEVPERLIVNLDKTDCILFVETILAMALNAKEGVTSIDSLGAIITRSRYRDGVIDGYSSRIHYTSEWILQGEKRGIVKEISKELANELSGQKFFFMTTHTNSYKQLKDNPAEVAKIKEVEERLNKREYYYIPKEQIPNILDKLQSGDIVGFNANIPGLDITHVGIIYKENGKTTFIHASMSGGKVMIEPKGLVKYANDSKNCNGIRVIRVN